MRSKMRDCPISHRELRLKSMKRPEESVMVEKDCLVRETLGSIGEIKDTLFPLVLSAEIGSLKMIVSRSTREFYDDVNEITILILTISSFLVSIRPLSK